MINTSRRSSHGSRLLVLLLSLLYLRYDRIRKFQQHLLPNSFWTTTNGRCSLFVASLIPADNNKGIATNIRNAVSITASVVPWIKQQQQQQQQQSKCVTTSDSIDAVASVSTTTTTITSIHIRTTAESDLTDIASLLATASQQQQYSSSSQLVSNNSWRNHIDWLFAKSDIETLIRRRWRILDLGRWAVIRMKKQLVLNQPNTLNTKQQHKLTREQFKYLWSTNDELRQEIQMAATETGEDTIWRHHHPMVITPLSFQWFNHLQMSANSTSTSCSDDTSVKATKTSKTSNFPFSFIQEKTMNTPISKVVGFCEVAMLSNPMYNEFNYTSQVDTNDCIVSMMETKNNTRHYFSPAIANLAIAPNMRRQGIATNLLHCAERYVATYWENATTIGLYVSTKNEPAINLYEKCGYTKVTIMSSTMEDESAMWYMSKSLRRK